MEGGSIAAVMEDIQTRTAVTDQGIFTWSAGDKVWLEITANPGYVTGTLSTGAGTGSANFAYGSYFGDMTGKAIYPFNTGHDISGDQLSVVLPATYDLGSNLGNTNAAMYGVETSGKIKFNHLAGVMRFNFRSVPAGVNKFVITLDKKINGTFTADLTEEHPVLQTESTSDESEKTITLNFDDLTQTQDINIYVPLPLGTYTTLELALMDDEETVWDYSNTITNTVNRKSLLLMPTVNVTGSISGDLEGGDVVEGENPSDAQDGDYVDEYGINHGQGVEIDGVIWAPVNCGYHETDFKYGKLYQWGRKYGQGYDGDLFDLTGNNIGTYSDALVPSVVNGPVSLLTGQAESNSTTFYRIYSDPYDWITTENDELWNSGTEDNPVKTEYDPCPDGWRVPTYAELSNLSSNYSSWTIEDSQNGYWFSGRSVYSESVSCAFFTAAGIRSGNGGPQYTRGRLGYYWSSSPLDTYSYCLDISSANSVFMSDICRAAGCSVRCVRASSSSDSPVEPSEPAAVDLSAAGTANSYIVSEAGLYMFVPTKGNSNESVGTISSVEVLWETFGTSETPTVGSLISSVSYEDGNIIFSTPESFREGNAVIAAKDASGTILWSWHIWLTDQPEEQVYYNNAGTMMDRNLGATSATPGDVGALGLLYQWGRKDPFLGSSSISSSTVAKSTITWPSYVSSNSSNGTIAYATEHPTAFIGFNSNNYDWYYTGSSSTDNTRWQSEKTIYDPCPVGWCVPDGGSTGIVSKALGSSSAFEDDSLYDSTNEGMNFFGKFGNASTIWYPASGYRSDYDGSLYNVGSLGYYWSVSPYSYYAYSLDFYGYNGRVRPSNYYNRAGGQAVRCVREDSVPDVPEDPSEPDSSQPSYSLHLKPSTYGWVQSTTVSNPDASLYDGVYESTNQGMSSTKSIMYIDIDGYDTFTFYVRSYAESQYDYVIVSNLDVDITSSTSGFKMTTSGNQQSGTSLSSYTEVTFTNIGGGQHRIMVAYKKDHSVDNGNDKGYVLIPKNQNQTSQTPSAIDLSSNGTANSYIVSGAGSYKFTPTKGNSSESVGTIASVEVLWESFGTSTIPSDGSLISEVNYENGSILFSTPESFKEGNAVIAAKDANGTILWSWHIWLTDEPEGQVYYNDAGTMMDRNLGATSTTPGDVGALGLLYQWGRKDPFLNSSSISSDIVAKSTIIWPSAVSSDSSNGTIEYATEHPTTFIKFNSSNNDWYYTGSYSTDNTRWQPDKTIYDPCPSGWRVPDGGSTGVWSEALGSGKTFTDESLYDSTNAGMDFSSKFGSASTIWYPASGCRSYYDGGLSYVGSSGSFWSESAEALNFYDDGYVDQYFYDRRANGYSVRCVQE